MKLTKLTVTIEVDSEDLESLELTPKDFDSSEMGFLFRDALSEYIQNRNGSIMRAPALAHVEEYVDKRYNTFNRLWRDTKSKEVFRRLNRAWVLRNSEIHGQEPEDKYPDSGDCCPAWIDGHCPEHGH